MSLKLVLITVLVIVCLLQRLYYTAAVVEYAPEGNSWELSPPEIIAANVNNYLSLIAQASTQVKAL